MQTRKAYSLAVSLSLLAACAGSTPPPLPSPGPSPQLELFEVPAGACPGYSFDFALTATGLDAFLNADIIAEADCSKRIEAIQKQLNLSRANTEAAEANARSTEWWQRFGPIVAVGLGVVGVGVGAAAGFSLGRALHVRDDRDYQPARIRNKRNSRVLGAPRQRR